MKLYQLPLIGLFLKKPVTRRKETKLEHLPAQFNLKILWLKIRFAYFPDRADLDNYSVSWSRRRQKRVLASCHIKKRSVVVASELQYEEHEKWLEPLLYHEMCHAVIGTKVEKRGRKRLWHGPQFRELEGRHPEVSELKKWIKSGDWTKAVRSHRGKLLAAKRAPRKIRKFA